MATFPLSLTPPHTSESALLETSTDPSSYAPPNFFTTFSCRDQVYLTISRFWCGETIPHHPILPSLLFLLICLQTALSCGGESHDQGSCTVYAQRWYISQAVFLTREVHHQEPSHRIYEHWKRQWTSCAKTSGICPKLCFQLQVVPWTS